MLDYNCKPWLIEVNHSPSFCTDSPLDYNIKKNVIRDTLHILNLSWKRKNKYLNQFKNEKEKRLVELVKISNKQKQTEKEQRKQRKLAKKDKYENSNMGDFQNLYPLPKGVSKEQDKLMDFYDNIYFKRSR
jgi:tubulin polyglutamylase TTLL6/13